MTKDELKKIDNSPYLSDEAKEIYKRDRERYLKDQLTEKEKDVKNLSAFIVNNNLQHVILKMI